MWIRKPFGILCALILISLAPIASQAQDYPSKPVRVIVPWPPGGGTDVMGRLIATRLSSRLGQSFVVDNRAGAASNIGMAAVAAAAPDGYTLGMATSNLAINPALMSSMPFDPMNDLVPVALVAKGTYAFAVHPSVPAQNVQQLLALVRQAPDKFNASTAGVGSPGHLAVAQLNAMAGVNITPIHYKGGAPATNATVGGETQIMFTSYTTMAPLVQAGKLRLLAVTGPKRSRALPDTPTVVESGLPSFVFEEWYALFAPAKTPRAVIDRLNAEVRAILAEPEVADRVLALGAEVQPGAPEALGALLSTETARLGKLVRDANIKAE
jgi:tripartite-type tricarboxylate transporter receptor subunit TctC